MQIIDNLIIILLHILCFIAGMKIANYYSEREYDTVRAALEKQFVRLRLKIDADDPSRPFIPDKGFPKGDTDGDLVEYVSPQFMDELKTNGKAKTSFRKSDLTKSPPCGGKG